MAKKIFDKLKIARKGGVLLLTTDLCLKRRKYKRSDPAFFDKLKAAHTQLICTQICHNLKKRYARETQEFKARIIAEDKTLPHDHEKIIWICWLQGMSNAPEIVRMCYQSVCDNFSRDFRIITLDEKNIKDYVSLPEYIEEKYKKGYISKQWYSDLVRLELLDKYGGTWIDATIFCSGQNVPDYMMNDDLFIFQTLYPATWGISTVMNSYFITACRNNKIIKLTKLLFFEYWKKNDICCDYWLIYNFFEIAITEFSEEWQKVIPYDHTTMHILQSRMKMPFDKRIFDATTERVPFHKLLWIFSTENFDKKGTLYEYLIINYPIYQGKDKNE